MKSVDVDGMPDGGRKLLVKWADGRWSADVTLDGYGDWWVDGNYEDSDRRVVLWSYLPDDSVRSASESTEDCLRDYRNAISEMREYVERARSSAKRAMPKGCTVTWKHGSHERSGVVVDHSIDLRVWVRTDSGAKPWIGSSRVTSVDGIPMPKDESYRDTAWQTKT